MKLVITTQYMENYGSEDEPFWKFKGGEIFVVSNLTKSQSEKIIDQGISTLKSLIEYSNPMTKEYIIEYSVVEDHIKICEEWESPTQLSWTNSRWTASRVTENDGFSMMRSEIAKQIETWDLMMNGGHENYSCSFIMRETNLVVKESDVSLELLN